MMTMMMTMLMMTMMMTMMMMVQISNQARVFFLSFFCSSLGMVRSKPAGVDLPEEVAKQMFASAVPASCLQDLASLFPYKGAMNRAPLWDSISKHRHLLSDMLEGSGGQPIRQSKLYDQLLSFVRSLVPAPDDKLPKHVLRASYRLRTMLSNLRDHKRNDRPIPMRYSSLKYLLDKIDVAIKGKPSTADTLQAALPLQDGDAEGQSCHSEGEDKDEDEDDDDDVLSVSSTDVEAIQDELTELTHSQNDYDELWFELFGNTTPFQASSKASIAALAMTSSPLRVKPAASAFDLTEGDDSEGELTEAEGDNKKEGEATEDEKMADDQARPEVVAAIASGSYANTIE